MLAIRQIVDPASSIWLMQAPCWGSWCARRTIAAAAPVGSPTMDFHVECEAEEDGRWIGEVPELQGVLVYGQSADEATIKANAGSSRHCGASGARRGAPSIGSYFAHRCMNQWPSSKARWGLAARFASAGRSSVKRVSSHPEREGWADCVFAFHDNDEIGPRMLSHIAKHTGLEPKVFLWCKCRPTRQSRGRDAYSGAPKVPGSNIACHPRKCSTSCRL